MSYQKEQAELWEQLMPNEEVPYAVDGSSDESIFSNLDMNSSSYDKMSPKLSKSENNS